jgi:hypothetical protein
MWQPPSPLKRLHGLDRKDFNMGLLKKIERGSNHVHVEGCIGGNPSA